MSEPSLDDASVRETLLQKFAYLCSDYTYQRYGNRDLTKMTRVEIIESNTAEEIDLLRALPKLEMVLVQNIDSEENLNGIFIGISVLKNMKSLFITRCNSLKSMDEIRKLLQVKRLEIISCPSLFSITHIDDLIGLEQLRITSCLSLVSIADIGELRELKKLEITKCDRITSIADIGDLPKLMKLEITNCDSFTSIGAIGDLPQLEKLEVRNCDSLISISIERAKIPKLCTLIINSCECLQSLGVEIGYLFELHTLQISSCNSLVSVDPGQLTKLKTLEIFNCPSLESITNIGNIRQLQTLRFLECDSLVSVEALAPKSLREMLPSCVINVYGKISKDLREAYNTRGCDFPYGHIVCKRYEMNPYFDSLRNCPIGIIKVQMLVGKALQRAAGVVYFPGGAQSQHLKRSWEELQQDNDDDEV